MFNIKWDNDVDYTQCINCNNKFTFTVRKHHCRCCGKIFCKECLTKYNIFDKSHSMCYNCSNYLDNSLIISKNEIYNINNELDKYKNELNNHKNELKNYKNELKNHKNELKNCNSTHNKKNNKYNTISTQTENNYTGTSFINKIEKTNEKNEINEKIENFKSKSLDIIECINTASKNNPIQKKTPAENEILKYQEDKNKRYLQELKKQELNLKIKEEQLKQFESDLIKQKQEQEQDLILKQKQEQDLILKRKQEGNLIKQQQESDKLLKKNLEKEEKKIGQILSTRDAVLKRKIDKKKAEEEKYMNELQNIQNNYKNEINDAINYKF